MINNAEREWAKAVGLKKTKLITYFRCKKRNVYQDKFGNLYYINANKYHGTSIEYCYDSENNKVVDIL